MTISHAVPPVSLASVLYGVHDVRLQERPTPRPGPREVLVEVRAVGVCGSDVHYYDEGRIGRYVVESPLVLGHEAAGAVVATGAQARRHVPGARVAIEPGVPCLHCHECRTGHYNLCASMRFFATPPVDGAFARYVTIHEDFAHPLPDSLDDNAGALLEPLSVAVWAAWKADIRTGDSVLVTGAGPVGLLAVQVARASGATEIVVSDSSAPRLALAARLGATHVIDSSRERVADAGVAADVLIECAGHPSAVAEGLLAVRPAGRAVLVGVWAAAEFALPVQVIQNQEIRLTGTFRYANTYPTAISLVASGAVDFGALVTSHHGLAQVEDALTVARRDSDAVKPIVLPTTERVP